MLEITLADGGRAQYQEKADQTLVWEINHDGDLKVKLNGEMIAFYPIGQWKYVVSLRDEFHKFVTATSSSYILNYQLYPPNAE